MNTPITAEMTSPPVEQPVAFGSRSSTASAANQHRSPPASSSNASTFMCRLPSAPAPPRPHKRKPRWTRVLVHAGHDARRRGGKRGGKRGSVATTSTASPRRSQPPVQAHGSRGRIFGASRRRLATSSRRVTDWQSDVKVVKQVVANQPDASSTPPHLAMAKPDPFTGRISIR